MLNKKYDIKQIGEDKRTLEIYLYGEIQGDYYDWWTGKVVESTTSANYVRKAIDEAGKVDNINIYINSCGGSVSEGIAIYNILKRSAAYKTVYVDAFAYSIASVIAMVGDKVIMPSNTTMMIHNAMQSLYDGFDSVDGSKLDIGYSLSRINGITAQHKNSMQTTSNVSTVNNSPVITLNFGGVTLSNSYDTERFADDIMSALGSKIAIEGMGWG